MMTMLCLVYLLPVIISVSSSPLGQLVQSCNVCKPSSYNNLATIPVVIQQPSSSNPYPQPTTVQVPAGCPGPLGDTLNQIILNRILSNPSLQKIADPNTKLYKQNGDEVQRQVPNTGTPNVINNYFIVPPEFFNLNETIGRSDDEEVRGTQVDKTKRPRRRKLRRLKKVDQSSAEEEELIQSIGKRGKLSKSDNVKRKRKRINDRKESTELTNELDESQETVSIRDQERERNKRKQQQQKINKQTLPLSIESDEVDLQEIEDLSPSIANKRVKEIKKIKKPKINIKNKVDDEESDDIEPEILRDKTLYSEMTREIDDTNDTSQTVKTKKKQRKESKDKILKNIEIPTDISNRVIPENRKTRDSKRRETKREPESKTAGTPKKEPVPNITPFSDDVLKNFFPYMGNFYNSNTNYPYNFDQYYQHPNPVRNPNTNRYKKKRKNQNRKINDPNSNIHTIEIKLKPRKKENTTETPLTTEQPKDVYEVMMSLEVEQSAESIEQVTDIPMEMPHKVFPVTKEDTESSSKESYETFSKLEDLHDFITPELGTEDEILPMISNGIINDYYPVFDDDVYYNPYAEKVKSLDDDRYFYETSSEDKINKEKRKYDKYEDSRVPKRDISGKKSESPVYKTKKTGQDINEFNSNEYLDHISKFSETPEHEIVKSSDGIRRVKVSSKNARVKPETVETVFAGSKVAKFGIQSDETIEDSSSYVHFDESYPSEGHTTYVVAKSLGRPEDYW